MIRMIALALGLVLTAAAFTARAAEQQQPPNAQTTAPPEPRSCQQLHNETNKCDTGMRSCDQRVIARLEAQCQRDEKRLPQVLGPRDGERTTAVRLMTYGLVGFGLWLGLESTDLTSDQRRTTWLAVMIPSTLWMAVA